MRRRRPTVGVVEHVRAQLAAAVARTWGVRLPRPLVGTGVAGDLAAFDAGEPVVVPVGYLPPGLRGEVSSDHVEVDRTGRVVAVWPVCFFPVVDGRVSRWRHALCWSPDGAEDLDEETARVRFPAEVERVHAGIVASHAALVRLGHRAAPADPNDDDDQDDGVVDLDARRWRR